MTDLVVIIDENAPYYVDVGPTVIGGGGGVTSHSGLTGLGNDDHIQYFNTGRGDARYQKILVSGSNIKTVNGTSLLGSGDVTISSGTGTGTSDHGSLLGLTDDDHPQYLTSARADAVYAPLVSPAITGIPIAPTAIAGTNTAQIATTEFVSTALNNVVLAQFVYYESATATAGQLVFTFPTVVGVTLSNSIAIVFIDGIQQTNTIYYTRTAANEITFTTALLGGEKVDVAFIGYGASTGGTTTTPHTHTLSEISDWPISVSAAEVNYLSNVTSDIQAQLDSKQNTMASGLDGLTDVVITTPITGQSLNYNGATWVNAAPVTGVTAHELLTGLTTNDDHTQYFNQSRGDARYSLLSHTHSLSQISDWPTAVSATEVSYLDNVTSSIQTQLNSKAPSASPALTGIPTAPTATIGTNSAQLATTSFVLANSVNTLADLGITATAAELNYTTGVTSGIQSQLNAKAPLVSPALTGTPTAPTAVAGTNTTQIATTAFVLANSGSGGITDHGLLNGLLDDDHPQYHNNLRGDARYSLLGHTHTISQISDWPAAVTMTEIGYVDGVTSSIQTQLNAKQATLVSGTNIKTINGSSLLGSGNLTISGSGWVPDATTHDYHIPTNSTTDSAGIRMYGASTDYVMLDNYRPSGQLTNGGFRVVTVDTAGGYVIPIQTYQTGETYLTKSSSGEPLANHVTYNYRINFNSKVSGVTPPTANAKLTAKLTSSTYGDHVLKTQSTVSPAFTTSTTTYTPTIWGSNELQLKNTGTGRVNNTNMLLECGGDIRSDNTNLFMYQKAGNYAQTSSLEYGGTVGIWMVADARSTSARAIGGEIVMIGDKLEYDPNPAGSLSTIPSQYTANGKASFGWRVSNLEAATTEGQTTQASIFPRAIDVWGSGNKGFDTALALNGWRSRGLYIGNTLDSTVQGGTGFGIHIERNVPNIFVTGTALGAAGEQYNLSFVQQYSAAKNAQYFTFRKDAGTTWFSMYNDATVTLSTTSTGAGLTINPSGLIAATRTGAGASNAAFAVPTGGRVYLDGGSNTYISFDGNTIRIYKNGSIVASW